MARPPKGKPLTFRPVRFDDEVWAEFQRLGKLHGTINEGARVVFGWSDPDIRAAPAVRILDEMQRNVDKIVTRPKERPWKGPIPKPKDRK